MVAALGLPVTVCGSFGGETGLVRRTLMGGLGLPGGGGGRGGGRRRRRRAARRASRPAVAGAEDAIISRADRPALATLDGGVVGVEGPRLEALDMRGAGTR